MEPSANGVANSLESHRPVGAGAGPGLGGYGSVVAPSVGSDVSPSVGSSNVVPTWRNTGPAAPLPSVPTVGNTFRSTFTRTGLPRGSTTQRIRLAGIRK